MVGLNLIVVEWLVANRMVACFYGCLVMLVLLLLTC